MAKNNSPFGNILTELLTNKDDKPDVAKQKASIAEKMLKVIPKHMESVTRALSESTLYEIGQTMRGKGGPEQDATLGEAILNRLNNAMVGKGNMMSLAAAKAFRGDNDAGVLMQVAEKEAGSLAQQYVANVGNLNILAEERLTPGKYAPEALDRARAGLRSATGLYKSGDKLYQMQAGMLSLAQSYQLAFNQVAALGPLLRASGGGLAQVGRSAEQVSRDNENFIRTVSSLVKNGIITPEEGRKKVLPFVGVKATEDKESIE